MAVNVGDELCQDVAHKYKTMQAYLSLMSCISLVFMATFMNLRYVRRAKHWFTSFLLHHELRYSL